MPVKQDSQKVLEEFVDRYGPRAGVEGPIHLVEEVFNAEPDEWQADVLRDFGRGERRMGIRSAHGSGKTCALAWLVWCMLLTRFPQKTIATAPTRGQLFDNLYAEVLTWGKRLPPAILDLYNVKTDRISLIASPAESFFSARTARTEQPEALQGIHSEHVLIIGDEASGIPEAIFEAAGGSMSGEHATTVLAGNPLRTSGLFFDVFHKLQDMWKTYHIRGPFDWPTGIVSERITLDFMEEQARKYGEDSSAFYVRALGEFPKADDDTVIPYEYVASARMREIVLDPEAPEVWGLDVARFGSAKNALVRRTHRAVTKVEYWSGTDLMGTTGRVKREYDALPPHLRPETILVDVIGLGAGVVDRLYELNLPVRGINVAETAPTNDIYQKLRSELWWRAREWLARKDVVLPMGGTKEESARAELLAEELVAPKYAYQSSGRILVESKDDMRKRKLPSPDVADAFVLTFAEEPAIIAAGGAGTIPGNTPWGQPLPSRAGGIV